MVADLAAGDPSSAAVGTDTHEYYGSLFRTMLSLYQAITGGVSWRVLVDPLFDHNSPAMALLMCCYIAFAVLAMLNVITGMFVDSALKRCTAENRQNLLNTLAGLVANIPQVAGCIRLEDFKEQLSSPQLQLYFEEMDLTTDEAEALFHLLDFEKTGAIDAEQFVMGCIRIHGHAKAIDLVTLMSEVHLLHRRWETHATFVEQELQARGSAGSPYLMLDSLESPLRPSPLRASPLKTSPSRTPLTPPLEGSEGGVIDD